MKIENMMSIAAKKASLNNSEKESELMTTLKKIDI
jgi:hypothetical protein